MGDSVVLHDALISSKIRDRKFQILLDACDDQQIFACKPEKNQEVISAINSRLNEIGTRASGIPLLKSLLLQCSDRVFVENCITWATHCLKPLANVKSADDAYETLRMIIDMSHNFQELTKQITGNIIPKVLEHILKPGCSVAALECLEVVLHYYPGPCKSKVNNVQRFLLRFLDEENEVLVEHASRCMCYLPLLMVTGHNDGTAWTEVLTDLCATASTVMYELFEGVHEVNTPACLAGLSVGFQLKTFSGENPFANQYRLATRLKNILTFIEGMLSGDLQYVKAVRADLLVAISYRVLAVNCKMVSRGTSMEHVALMCVLPSIHVAVFNLLQTYISCCSVGLLKYGPLFCKLALQTLKWTSGSNGYGVERSYRHLREAVYNFLGNWVLRAKAASCVELLAEELIGQMLQDIFQKKESVTLQFQEKGKKSSNQQLPQVRQQLADLKLNADPCAAALQALSAIVITSGALLRTSLHMRLQEVVVALLLEIQRSSGPEDVPVPYSATSCRLQLYRLLLTLTLHPHPQWPPPTQFALEAFPSGQHDTSLEVAGFCTMALACTRQMVHPSRSTHQFPISVEEMRTSAGLSHLQPVQGIDLKSLNRQDLEQEDSERVQVSGFEKSLQSPLSYNNFQEEEASNLTAMNKISKKNVRTSETDLSVNGVDSKMNTSNSSSKSSKKKRRSYSEGVSDKENASNSDKSLKKRQHLQFTVEELLPANNRKTTRNSGQDWEVTEVTEKRKEKKDPKFVDANEISVATKRRLESPTVSPEKNKTRKLDETPSQLIELEGSLVDSSSHKSPGLDTNESSEAVNRIMDKTPKKEDNDVMIMEHASNNKVFESTAEDGVSTLDVSHKPEDDKEDQKQNKKARVSDSDKEVQKEKNEERLMKKDVQELTEKEITMEEEIKKKGVEEVTENELVEEITKKEELKKKDVQDVTENELVEKITKKEELKKKGVQEVTEKELGEEITEVIPVSINTEANRYNLRREKLNSPAKVGSASTIESKSNDGQKNDKSPVSSIPDKSERAPQKGSGTVPVPTSSRSVEDGKAPKTVSPVVELMLSSDSEQEQQKKTSSCYRRITRSLAKRASTPQKSSEVGVAIEELPSSQESLTSEMLSEISRLELSAVATEHPNVEFVESDESDNLVLRLDSDHDSLEILDVTGDAKEIQDTGKKEETVVFGGAQSSSGVSKSPTSKNLKDSVASDREMEEDSEGMEAVAHSPDIAVEEAALSADKESTAKKHTAEEDGSGSETAEEDILKTFVDVIAPKSA